MPVGTNKGEGGLPYAPTANPQMLKKIATTVIKSFYYEDLCKQSDFFLNFEL